MRITCPGCSAEFNVDDGRIPPQGTTVRCPKCFKAVDVKPQSEAQSLDSALLGGGLPGGDDPFSGEFTQPEAMAPPPAAVPEDAPIGPGPATPPPRTPTSPPSTVHAGLPGDGLVDDVWSGSGPKDKGTEMGMPSQAPGDPQTPGAAGESIFDADLSWSEDRPAGPGPVAADGGTAFELEDSGACPGLQDMDLGETFPAAEPVIPQVSGLDETAIAQSPDIEDLEAALAELEASSGVVSGADGDPVAAEPLMPSDDDELAEGFDQLDAALAPRDETGPVSEGGGSFHSDAGFAPLDQVGGDEGFEIERDTISQDNISPGAAGLASRDGGPRTFEGGGPTIDDIDFDSLLDDLPGDESGGDTFFVDSPEGGDAGGPAFDGPSGGGRQPLRHGGDQLRQPRRVLRPRGALGHGRRDGGQRHGRGGGPRARHGR